MSRVPAEKDRKYHWRGVKKQFFNVYSKMAQFKMTISQHSSDAQTSFVLSYLFIYYIFGYIGSSLLCVGFLYLQRVEATL